MDRFKQVNDSLGHDVGDAVLKAIAETLRHCVGETDFLARFGGDEFVVVQDLVLSEMEAIDFASRIRRAASITYDLGPHRVAVEVTIGTALAPLHGDEPNQILKAADLALYKAKSRGTTGELFAPQMAMVASRLRRIEVGLASALADRQLSLVFQPIVGSARPQRIVALEALLRWKFPDGTTIPPSEFVPVAERTGAIVEIGEWALAQACQQCCNWPADVRVAVNVSPVQFFRGDLLTAVKRILTETGLAPNRLELEITESILISDTTFIDPILSELRWMGIRVALDDFGSGYCGLHYLRQFTIDKIKVDKTIIDEACASEKALNILRGVAKIALESGMTVTVEGVDNQEKAELLNREKCADELQGFFFSRPVSARIAAQMLRLQRRNVDEKANVISIRRPE
ncbi:bifunctional diguanylate cyclase/phosphodiesterase (plasmid) [Mesorhizobium sp. AR02]|uniref:putative bifunctional diguanylate cyclase/phosphodiesterase n=1 Tax=Mesorhizobium sp. AR02 TaxID=2865837 RepID=UPI002160CC0A|nr:bifunctional diguanylate cyclase/phosphodiesterase [Mesorhizobium sp. AR02]UVK57304.1 bifunctional diguanylate cyclase/phosphodiesterase [Mesorhizobium sp. AR02]